MARRPRHDAPGVIHHVSNHGIDGLIYIRGRADARRFLLYVIREVRRGTLRLHHFALMGTHMHMMLESLTGDLSGAMRRLQSAYGMHLRVRYDHGGYKTRSRFFSEPIESRVYAFNVIRYLDLNAVKAHPGTDIFDHEFSSAVLQASSPRRPIWLARGLVNGFFTPDFAELTGNLRAERYRARFHAKSAFPTARLIEARMTHRARGKDELDALLAADLETRQRWLVARCQVEPKVGSYLPVADTMSVRLVMDGHRAGRPEAPLPGDGGNRFGLWDVLEVGLLRELAGLGLRQTGRVLELSDGAVGRRLERFRRAMKSDPIVLRLAAELLGAIFHTCFGSVDDILGPGTGLQPRPG